MKTTVEISWDKPKEQGWLCPENIALALHAYCKNTKFKVREIVKLKQDELREILIKTLKEFKQNEIKATI